jgi:DNA-binding beta-propeller fold protein YncE
MLRFIQKLPVDQPQMALALSEDDKTLFIANADNNCLAVFDVSSPGQSKSKGFIPVGWYPTNIKVVGKKILVSNGKGFSSMANPHGPNPLKPDAVWYQHGDTSAKQEQYIGGLFKGTLSIIDVPTEKQMSWYSQVVYQNTPYSKEKRINCRCRGRKSNPSKSW